MPSISFTLKYVCSTFLAVIHADLPRLAMALAIYFCLGTIELLFPAETNQSWRGRIRNGFYTMLCIMSGLIFTCIASLVAPCRPWIREDSGILNSILICCAYVFVFDFLFYWYHCAQHHIKLLWSIHELHHSDAELNTSSSMRSFWLEIPLQAIFISIPTLNFIGVDKLALLLFPLVTTSWLIFTHANIRLRLGFLTPWLCGPQLHRIHHSKHSKHYNKNFAQFFPVFDILFGTYYAPQKDEFPETGTPTMSSNVPIREVLKRPFVVWYSTMRTNYNEQNS